MVRGGWASHLLDCLRTREHRSSPDSGIDASSWLLFLRVAALHVDAICGDVALSSGECRANVVFLLHTATCQTLHWFPTARARLTGRHPESANSKRRTEAGRIGWDVTSQ